MLLRSPRDLHYPITIRDLLKQDKEYVNVSDPLFSYTYKTTVTERDTFGDETKVEKDFTTRYESAIEGDLIYWRIKPGTVITSQGTALCEVKEACTHDVQYGGLCTICGKDLTVITYNTTVPETQRQDMRRLPHVRDSALTVSQNELNRTENEAKRRLLSSKKLSLVVDLDQTVIHATVDPTVAEWQQDESNPNHDAVKNVAAFQLRDDNGQWVWYYIKQRPGLAKFFENISKLYQLHIYTMGTRAYAENIAKIIDPNSTLFGDRILSRTDIPEDQKHKNLEDLFPVDTKMVVIIDDRADVWNYSDYLVKVVPYEFFVGIGDINSAFLARAPTNSTVREKQITATNGVETIADAQATAIGQSGPSAAQPIAEAAKDNELLDGESPLSQIMSLNEGNDAASLESKTEEQKEVLAAQVSERPLLQRQKIQDKEDEEADEISFNGDEPEEGDQLESQKQRHSILRDDDEELDHLANTLSEIHRRFFDVYDQASVGSVGGRIAELRGTRNVKRKPNEEVVPDVKDIIAMMKRELSVLQNTVLVFSKIAPLQTDIKETLVGKLATTYGATISSSVSNETTHLITIPDVGPDPRKGEPAKIFLPSTSKVNAARRLRNTKVILDPYILDSSVSFKRLSEDPYEIRLVGGPDDKVGESADLDEVADVEQEAMNLDTREKDDPTSKDSKGKKPPPLDISMADDADEVVSFSPTDAESRDFWANNVSMLLELSDEDIEDISDDSEDSDSGSPAPEGEPQKRKRVRSRASTENPSEPEDAAGEGLGSELQKRKKRALQRTSSLTKVSSTVDAGSISALGSNRKSVNGEGGRIQEDDESDLAADEDRLAAELAGLDDDDDDDDL